MLAFGPILRSLSRRKFGVFLLVFQIGFSVAIFSNLSWAIDQLLLLLDKPSGIEEKSLFGVLVRPATAHAIHYTEATRDINDIKALPGVVDAAIVRWLPLSGYSGGDTLLKSTLEKDVNRVPAISADVGPGWLHALGLKLLEGRDFEPTEITISATPSDDESKTVIITRSLADTLFGANENAVGKILYEGKQPRQVIGVTSNWKGFTTPFPTGEENTSFIPRYVDNDVEHRYLIRTESQAVRGKIMTAVEQMINTRYQYTVLLEVNAIDDVAAWPMRGKIILSRELIGTMIALGLVIAFAISGQTLFWANQRIKQFGIRRALGASKMDILQLILTETGIICGLGILLGVGISVVVNQAILALATDWQPMSPWLLIAVAAVVLVGGLLSACIPGWRASQVMPGVSIRNF